MVLESYIIELSDKASLHEDLGKYIRLLTSPNLNLSLDTKISNNRIELVKRYGITENCLEKNISAYLSNCFK